MGINLDTRQFLWQSLLGGGIAGVAARTVTSPLDVIKTLSQVGTIETESGFLRSWRAIYTRDGLKGFWRGNGVACLRLFPFSGLEFGGVYIMKILLMNPENGRISAGSSAVAGALSGAVATAGVYPLEVIKTRLTVQRVQRINGKNGSSHYKGIADAFKVILRDEGAFALYKGLGVSLAGIIPYAGILFATYDVLDNIWGNKSQKTMAHHFLNGCIAASVAQTVSYPFDTIRKKLQAQGKVPSYMLPDVFCKGAISAVSHTIENRGIVGLWRGTTANLIKVAPSAGVLFATFEFCKRIFHYQNGYTVSPFSNEPVKGVAQDTSVYAMKEANKET